MPHMTSTPKQTHADYKAADDGQTHAMRGSSPGGRQTRCGRITHPWKGGARVPKFLGDVPTCPVCRASLSTRPAWT
jgi:hypothetical protein